MKETAHHQRRPIEDLDAETQRGIRNFVKREMERISASEEAPVDLRQVWRQLSARMQHTDRLTTENFTPQDSKQLTIRPGLRVRGTITGIERYGLLIQLVGTTGQDGRGLVAISQMTIPRGVNLKIRFKVGQEVEVTVLSNSPGGHLRLSLRQPAFRRLPIIGD